MVRSHDYPSGRHVIPEDSASAPLRRRLARRVPLFAASTPNLRPGRLPVGWRPTSTRRPSAWSCPRWTSRRSTSPRCTGGWTGLSELVGGGGAPVHGGILEEGPGVPIVDSRCRFLGRIMLDDLITLRTEVGGIGRTLLFRTRHTFTRGEEVVARGSCLCLRQPRDARAGASARRLREAGVTRNRTCRSSTPSRHASVASPPGELTSWLDPRDQPRPRPRGARWSRRPMRGSCRGGSPAAERPGAAGACIVASCGSPSRPGGGSREWSPWCPGHVLAPRAGRIRGRRARGPCGTGCGTGRGAPGAPAAGGRREGTARRRARRGAGALRSPQRVARRDRRGAAPGTGTRPHAAGRRRRRRRRTGCL